MLYVPTKSWPWMCVPRGWSRYSPGPVGDFWSVYFRLGAVYRLSHVPASMNRDCHLADLRYKKFDINLGLIPKHILSLRNVLFPGCITAFGSGIGFGYPDIRSFYPLPVLNQVTWSEFEHTLIWYDEGLLHILLFLLQSELVYCLQ